MDFRIGGALLARECNIVLVTDLPSAWTFAATARSARSLALIGAVAGSSLT